MGREKKKQDTAGAVNTYTYDNRGRILSHIQKKQDDTQQISVSYKYDKNGNKRFYTDENGITTESNYDRLNRLASTNITVTDINNVQKTTQQPMNTTPTAT